MVGAIVGAAQFGTVVSSVAWVADALPVDALALLRAFVLANFRAAIIVSPALVAAALVVGTSTMAVAVARTTF